MHMSLFKKKRYVLFRLIKEHVDSMYTTITLNYIGQFRSYWNSDMKRFHFSNHIAISWVLAVNSKLLYLWTSTHYHRMLI